ncbi:AraC family transcriptional regulator [Anaerotalea alkaliphila]|uniref:AraC family transcriptional regulator n=1 Tax=Anaerotalea alkaliphila TaxID=2662126 RepID=A0A7X5KM36_9FIRM|nr:AraC family transcriptional regulator [Anaerotalea alkaliphila]NDL67531.1 AraC family transcriptional regulator [Anaerotalea alkaliphila]
MNLLYFCDATPGKLLLHSHDFIEMMLIVDGNVSISAEGSKYSVKNGNMVIIPPGLLHCTIIEKDTTLYERFVIHLQPSFIEEATQRFGVDANRLLALESLFFLECNHEDRWRLRSLLERMAFAAERGGNIGTALLDCQARELVITVLDLMESGKVEEEGLKSTEVACIIDYIDRHFRNPDLSMEEIVSCVCLSPAYLSRLFKEYTGTSVYNYLIQKRLEFSKTLIKEGFLITAACLDSGFSDYTAYLKAFKKSYGTTPKRFQKTKAPARQLP